uniref:Vitellogenin n=1 Tax=Acrobeloides nanus TaxID=290746 RepID=A0A914CMV8_9BILA
MYTLDPNVALSLSRYTVTYEKKHHQMVLQVLVDPVKCIINHRDTAQAHVITEAASIQPYAVCLYPEGQVSTND